MQDSGRTTEPWLPALEKPPLPQERASLTARVSSTSPAVARCVLPKSVRLVRKRATVPGRGLRALARGPVGGLWENGSSLPLQTASAAAATY